jgi:hypothetical protein
MIDTDTTTAAPEWTRAPVQPPEESATGSYRGFYLTANSYGWNVLGRWNGYSVMASEHNYLPNRPSFDDNMTAAIAAADDLATKGWEPR